VQHILWCAALGSALQDHPPALQLLLRALQPPLEVCCIRQQLLGLSSPGLCALKLLPHHMHIPAHPLAAEQHASMKAGRQHSMF
jgi:hypothetical protein